MHHICLEKSIEPAQVVNVGGVDRTIGPWSVAIAYESGQRLAKRVQVIPAATELSGDDLNYPGPQWTVYLGQKLYFTTDGDKVYGLPPNGGVLVEQSGAVRNTVLNVLGRINWDAAPICTALPATARQPAPEVFVLHPTSPATAVKLARSKIA